MYINLGDCKLVKPYRQLNELYSQPLGAISSANQPMLDSNQAIAPSHCEVLEVLKTPLERRKTPQYMCSFYCHRLTEFDSMMMHFESVMMSFAVLVIRSRHHREICNIDDFDCR